MHGSDSRALSDAKLLNLLQQGDKTAFNLIYFRFWQKLYLSAYSILKNPAAAEDVVQEVMVSLWIRRETTAIENLNAYLYQSTRFQVFKLIRDDKFLKVSPIETVDIAIPNEGESMLEMDELNEILSRGIGQLPEKCRAIFLLRKHEHLSIKEIADRLDLSPKTVENQLTIALKKLRIFFKENTQETLIPALFACSFFPYL